MSTSPKEVLAKRYPDFVNNTTDLYEVSLDFWEKMDQTAHDNEIKLFEAYGEIGIVGTEEGRQKYFERLKILQEGHQKWIKVFPELRRRLDARKDELFYYVYRDTQDPLKSNQGILIVRDGRIRDKIVLNGEGAWKGE